MEPATIFERLAELDVSVHADRGEIVLNPGDRVPGDLREEIKLHKADLLGRLTDDSELIEIVRQVRQQGHVLLWSSVLQDLVAFAQTDADRENVPSSFTVYTVAELVEVFGDGTPSPGSLKLIHEAKKRGGRIRSEE